MDNWRNLYFSNSSHLEWRAALSDTILKGTHPGTISARVGLIWFSGFRGEDLNVKVYDVRRTDERRRTPSDGKISHGLWPGELNMTSHQRNGTGSWESVCLSLCQQCFVNKISEPISHISMNFYLYHDIKNIGNRTPKKQGKWIIKKNDRI